MPLSIGTASVISFASSVLGYLLIIIVVRSYPKDTAAVYLYSVALAMLATLVLDFAMDQCGSHYARTRDVRIEDVWSTITKYKIGLFLALVPVALVIGARAETTMPVAVMGLMIPAFYLGPIFEYREANVSYAALLLVEKTVLLSLVFVASNYSSDITWLFVAHTLASSLSFVLQVFSARSQSSVGRMETFNFASYVSAYGAVYLILLCQMAYGNISRLMIESKAGAIVFAQVTLVLQLVNVSVVVQNQVDRHARPEIARLVSERNDVAFQSLIKMYLVYLAIVLVVCCVGVIFADRVVVSLFGNEWVDIAPALRVGLLLVLSVAFMRLIDMLSVAAGLSKINLTVNAFSIAFLLGGIFLLPPQTAAVYISFIVGCQAVHVVVMGCFLRHRINMIFRLLARP